MAHEMDLPRLRVFTAVVEAGSVVAAATRLQVTPSAVSQAISHLEKNIGVKLFTRVSRRFSPTEPASELYTIVKAYSEKLGDFQKRIYSSRKELRGKLRVGSVPEFGARQVIHAAARFARSPGVEIEITYGLSEKLAAKVMSDQLDLAFCDTGDYLKRCSRLISYETVFEEKAILTCSRRFYEREIRGDHSFEHLTSLPHCEYQPDRGIIDIWYRQHFSKRPKDLNLRITAGQVRAIIEAAKNDLGLAFIPEYLIENELRTRKLVAIKTRRPEYVNPIVLVRAADKIPTLLEKEFVTGIKAVCAKLEGRRTEIALPNKLTDRTTASLRALHAIE